MYLQGGTSGHQLRDNAGNTTLEISPNGNCAGVSLEMAQVVTVNSGAGALTVGANSDIRLTNGNWTGDTTKIQHHSDWLYVQGGSNGIIFRHTNGSNRWQINSSGHLEPNSNNAYDIGSTSL